MKIFYDNMKTPIIKFSVILVLLFLSLNVNAQDFQGQAIYQSKTTFDMDGFGRGGQQMSEQQKKQIAERMKSVLEKTYVLNFNRSESTYKEEEKLEAPGQRGFNFMASFTAGSQYKNIKDKSLLQDQEFFGKQFLISDSLPQLEWKMGSESKQIGQYLCFKATAVKKVDETDWRSMRRRNRDTDDKAKSKDSTQTLEAAKMQDSTVVNDDPMSDIEVPKEIVVTAWYTPQIPISQGPAEYHGLPGLILEVNADRTTILCSKIVMNPEEKALIEAPTKGDKVTKKEYSDIVKKKMEEMREMYGGRNRGNRGGNRRN